MLVFAGFGTDGVSVTCGFKEIVWPQALQRVLVTFLGMASDLMLNFWLQYWQVICITSDDAFGAVCESPCAVGRWAGGRSEIASPQALQRVLETLGGILPEFTL